MSVQAAAVGSTFFLAGVNTTKVRRGVEIEVTLRNDAIDGIYLHRKMWGGHSAVYVEIELPSSASDIKFTHSVVWPVPEPGYDSWQGVCRQR